MAIEEFIKRFEKNNAFEALLIETGCKSAKSNTWNKVVNEVLLPLIPCQIRRWAIPSVLAYNVCDSRSWNVQQSSQFGFVFH